MVFFSASDIRQYTDFERMLDIIFESSTVYKEITRSILLELKNQGDNGAAQDKGLTGAQMSKLAQNYTKSTFYKVLNEYLLPLGILEKNIRTHRYFLSPEFPNAMRRLSEYWKTWMKESSNKSNIQIKENQVQDTD